MNNVVLKTERTEMRFPLDFLTPQIIVDAIDDKDTIEFMDAVPTMKYTEENAEMFMNFLRYTSESLEELELGIFDNETKKFIGMCTLENINREHQVCELGYWLSKAYVGNGYMTECVKAILKYAKNELKMKSVNAFVMTNHKRSISLLERIGFIKKEVLPNDTENKGKEVDRYWYKLELNTVE